MFGKVVICLDFEYVGKICKYKMKVNIFLLIEIEWFINYVSLGKYFFVYRNWMYDLLILGFFLDICIYFFLK